MSNGINTKFLEYKLGEKKLYIVRDHPTALLCWIKAYRENLIEKSSTLYHIDMHPDLTFSKGNKKKSIRLLNMNEEDIKKFIVEDLNSNHSEFIVNAMYSGLIIAGISFDFFEDENSKHIECNTEKSLVTQKRCTDIPNDIKHNYYRHQTQDISDLFGYQCLFEDTYVHQDTTKLYRESDRAILDIDLDFFTYRYNKTYPKHIDDIEHQITSDSFYNLLDKCSIVTIALEPKYCGGGTNSIEILNIFNECIFKPEGLNVIDKVESTLLNYEV